MNASRARKDGRNAFCPGDNPGEYLFLKGIDHVYYSLCFTQGWDEADSEYEAEQKSLADNVPEPDYRELFEAAKKYIDESPCDPDHYPSQLEAWQHYQSLLEQYNV